MSRCEVASTPDLCLITSRNDETIPFHRTLAAGDGRLLCLGLATKRRLAFLNGAVEIGRVTATKALIASRAVVLGQLPGANCLDKPVQSKNPMEDAKRVSILQGEICGTLTWPEVLPCQHTCVGQYLQNLLHRR
jgi:hypothetical protein